MVIDGKGSTVPRPWHHPRWTWRDGREFDDLQLRVHRTDDHDRSLLEVVAAPPRVAVADELVHSLTRIDPEDALADSDLRGFVFDRWRLGEQVRLVGDNREAVYRIVDYDLERFLWLLEWPD